MDDNQGQSVDYLFKVIIFPFRMLLKLFCFSVTMYDTVSIAFIAMWVTLKSLYSIVRPPPLKSLQCEVALVIGAGKGIGRAISLQLADLGTTVLCVDKNKVNNENVVKEITLNGGIASSYICDISIKGNIRDLMSSLNSKPTMLFYCCGLLSHKSMSTETFESTMKKAVVYFYWLIHEFQRHVKSNYGHIVALTSTAGTNNIHRSVVQHAVRGLTEALVDNMTISQVDNAFVTLIHIYPFIVDDHTIDSSTRSSFFGTISPGAAADSILDSVRRNYIEACVPNNMMFLQYLFRVLPRGAIARIKLFIDSGL